MPRTVYLIIYNSPVFPAHWGLWIPSLNDSGTGKFIEAEGDSANGFRIVFQRNHVVDATRRRYQSLPLAHVSDHHVVDVEGDGSLKSDSTAHDNLEQVLLSVPAPGASLVSSSSQVSDLTLTNCLLYSSSTGTKKTCTNSELSNVATIWHRSTGPGGDHG